MAYNLTEAEGNTAFEGLSIMGVTFSVLSALAGVYTVLFVIALWSTFEKTSKAHKRLRAITILLFVVLSVHYVARGVMFAQRRSLSQPRDYPFFQPRLSIPILFIEDFTTVIAGFASDGLLAWRFYIIFDRRRRALYIPMISVALNAVVGIIGSLQLLSLRSDQSGWWGLPYETTSQLYEAWGWAMFATNTALTGLIIARIVRVSSLVPADPFQGEPRSRYSTVIAAIVESALVNWVGLLLFGIANVAPHGRIITNLDVSFVMTCILPMFFGISQCLMIVRISLSSTVPTYGTPSNVKAENEALNGSGIVFRPHSPGGASSAASGLDGDFDEMDSTRGSPTDNFAFSA